MKYLVNRETKEHKDYSGTEFYDDEARRVVDADDDGWIKWNGKSKKCPLPAKAGVEVLSSYDDEAADHLLASGWSWKDEELTHYRPILPAESKDLFDETWKGIYARRKVDVFTRLASAVISAEAIPILIAEINDLLPEGYEVRRK